MRFTLRGISRRARRFAPALAMACLFVPSPAGAAGQTQPSKLAKPAKRKPSPAPLSPAEAYAKAWKILTDGAASGNVTKRTDAISALATIGPHPTAVELIEARLADKDPDVRRVAVATLGDIQARQAIPKLKQSLDDKNPAVSFAAAKALWKMGDRSGLPIFAAVLEGSRHPSSGLISSEISDARRELHSPMALAMIGVKEGSEALLGPFAMGLTVAEALAKDRSSKARALSAALLGENPTPETQKLLEEALGDKSWVVRAAAAQALGNFRDPALVPKLALLLSQGKTVQCMAAAAIIRIELRRTPPQPAKNQGAGAES